MRLNPPQQPADSLGARRPARATLPPFSLPPPPELPRAGTIASDGHSPETGGVRSSGGSSSQSTPSASALSSPGYSVAAMSSYGSPRQGTSQYSSQYGPGSRFQTSPARLQQPLAPKPPSAPYPKQPQLTPSLPPPSSPSTSSGFGGKLPPISSLIPRSPPSHYAAPRQQPMPPHPGHPGSGQPSPGHLARPVGAPLVTSTLGSPHFFRTPSGSHASGSNVSSGQYMEFNVGAYSVVRESSQQDRPFKCDMCTQCFSRNHDLKRHKRIHLAAKPFPCPHCQKCFSRKDALKRHSLVKACGGKKQDAQSTAEEGETKEKSESKSPSPAESTTDTELEAEVKPETTAEHDSNIGSSTTTPGG